MKNRALLTVRQIAGMAPGEFLADPAPRGAGRLEFRRLRTGTTAVYYRHTTSAGLRVRLPLGNFDATGATGLTLAEAREKVGELRQRYVDGENDLRAAQEEETAARDAAKRAAQAAELAEQETARDADKLTLTALCDAYADHLERGGKASARAVRAALVRHVGAFPKIGCKPAAAVTADDALELLEGLTEAGKHREAGKLRSYLRAAYGAAINAKRSPGALPALRRIGRTLAFNVVRDLGTVPGSSKTRDRALSVAELRAYWHRLRDLEAPAGPLLQLHLLVGAQRLEQLARATTADIDEDEAALLLLDSKGRRSEPRKHWVPLLPEARAALEVLRTPARGPHLFTMSYGERPTTSTTFAQLIRATSTKMAEAGEVSAPFTAGDIRRTVETRLAALGVPLEVRAHLQSHGLGGVQARHYDRHSYSAEKRSALRLLLGLLEGKPATVTPIRRKARS